MPSMFDDVAEFHIKILGQPSADTPSLISQEWLLERFRFLAEESNEYLEAGMRGDIVGAVDGLLDIIYVALGTLYIMGIPVQECWNHVQQANMSKVRGMTKRGNAFDAAKPTGWVAPEAAIAKSLGDALEKARHSNSAS